MNKEPEEKEGTFDESTLGQQEWPPVQFGGIMDGADVSEDEFRKKDRRDG